MQRAAQQAVYERILRARIGAVQALLFHAWRGPASQGAAITAVAVSAKGYALGRTCRHTRMRSGPISNSETKIPPGAVLAAARLVLRRCSGGAPVLQDDA
jgi:hypothetical protein